MDFIAKLLSLVRFILIVFIVYHIIKMKEFLHKFDKDLKLIKEKLEINEY